MKNLQLKDYSKYQGDLRGNPYYGSIFYMGGIPFQYELFTYSLMQMQQYNSETIEKRIYYDTVRSSFLPSARSIVSRHTIGDWVLMLDTDMYFDPDVCVRMLKTFEERKLMVLTAVYPYKKEPYFPVLYTWDKENKKYQIVKEWTTQTEELDIFEIQGSGSGCLMVRKDVFRYMEQELKEEPFAIRRPFDAPEGSPLGEDLSFFDRCRQLDIQVICDPKIRVGHIKPHPVEFGKEYEPHKIDPSI